MDLSLIVLAMFKISSKERFPLCLTESNCNITLLEGKRIDAEVNPVHKGHS
jgi:hypothetical protein